MSKFKADKIAQLAIEIAALQNELEIENQLADDSSENSIQIRWKHPELFDVGFVAVPAHFLELYSLLKPPLTSAEALFVLQLMNFKWGEKQPFPSYKTIAKRMGVTDKAVRRYASSLESKNYLFRNERKGKTNTFDLTKLFDALLDAKVIYGRKLVKKTGGNINE